MNFKEIILMEFKTVIDKFYAEAKNGFLHGYASVPWPVSEKTRKNLVDDIDTYNPIYYKFLEDLLTRIEKDSNLLMQGSIIKA